MIDDTANRGRHWTWAIYVAVAAFMVFGANHYTVFDDEALSCRLYAMPMGNMVEALWRGEDPDPPLYYLLQNGWVHLFGVGPFGLRSLSIVLFLAGLAVMRQAGATWFDRRTGTIALILCAVHPAHLLFGFAGRWYSAMFLMVGLLLWVSGRMARAMGWIDRPNAADREKPNAKPVISAWMIALWGLVAAGVCYTNYFGPVIVGLTWLVLLKISRRRIGATPRVFASGVFAVALFAPWMPTFWHHVTSFPTFGGGWRSMASAAGRLGLTLASGNLAGLTAVAVWAALVIGMVGGVAALICDWRRLWPLAIIALGAVAVGVVSRTLIDKYVLTVSGVFCLLAAGIFRGARAPERQDIGATSSPDTDSANLRENRSALVARIRETCPAISRRSNERVGRWAARMAICGLVVGWAGCLFNLTTGRHWSSLRWLDPFGPVTRALYEANWSRTSPDAVCSHPAARYDFALYRANDLNRNPIEKEVMPSWGPPRDGEPLSWGDMFRTDAREWLAAWEAQESAGGEAALFAKTPTATLELIERGAPPTRITTLETSGYADLPDWAALHAALDRRYVRAGPPSEHLEDPDAALKDRIDPLFRHARWRITVTTWRLKGLD